MLAELAADLAGEDVGLAFVYRVLDRIVERYQLHDVIAVIETPQTTRQVFRAGRRMLDPSPRARDRRLALVGQRGLHAEPDVIDPDTSAHLLSLIALGVRLDLLRHDASHDALTS